jgi:hypothetical protein
MQIVEWIVTNKEWAFSGIGVFIVGLFLSRAAINRKTTQKIKSGDNSINTQSISHK